MKSASFGMAILLGFVFVGAAVAQQTEESDKKKAESAIVEFQKFMVNANAHVRRAAADSLANVNSPLLVKPILEAIGTEQESTVKEALGRALAAQSCRNALTEQVRILELTNNVVERVLILEAFKKSRPDVGYELILRLAEHKNFEIRYAALDVLGSIKSKDGKSETVLLKGTSDPEAQIRLVSLESLKSLKAATTAARCVELVGKDPDWRVRSVAMAALRSFRVKEALQPLIDALKKEDGRLKDDALAALRDLTGFDYSGDPEIWQRWWTRVKDTYKVPTEIEIRDQKKLAEKALDAYTKKDRGYTPYHGITTRSKRMLFCVDVSGSMAAKVVLQTNDPKKLEEYRKRYGDKEYKIDLAREELINTIAGLEPYVKFNIVTFHTDVKMWKPNLVSANSGTKDDAIKFLTKLTPEYCNEIASQEGKGKTNTFDALNVIFGLTKQNGEKASKDHIVESDTVFFLTDGMPSAGRITDPSELVRYFKTINAKARIVFHCVTFGHGNESLLEPMSQSSGGSYLVIGL